MLRVKEFNSEYFIEKDTNKWLEEHKNIKLIDIKYNADQYSSNVLIIYESEEE